MADINQERDPVKDGNGSSEDKLSRARRIFNEEAVRVAASVASERATKAKPRERANGGGEGTTRKPRRDDNRPGGVEDGVALDFARRHAGDFCYIAKWGRWMCWDGARWQHEDTLRAFDEARVLCRKAEDAKAKTVAAVVTLARADRALAATEEQWDIGDMIFNIPTQENDAP